MSSRHYLSKPLPDLCKAHVSRCRALLSGRDVTRVGMAPWASRAPSWRSGSSLPLRYQNGLSGRERSMIHEEANKASSTCRPYCQRHRRKEGTVSRSICPAALRGALRRARWTTYMSKVDLVVWRRPARAVYEVIMTKFSCFALAAADMKHVYQVTSRFEVS